MSFCRATIWETAAWFVVGLGVAGHAALPQAVIPLGVEQAFLVEARLLELVVHVGGQHEVIPVPDQGEELAVGAVFRRFIAVVPDVAAPPGPFFLWCGVGVEAAGVHVGDAVLLDEIGEKPFKAFAAVGESGGGGQACAGADDDGVRFGQGVLEPGYFVWGAAGFWGRRLFLS